MGQWEGAGMELRWDKTWEGTGSGGEEWGNTWGLTGGRPGPLHKHIILTTNPSHTYFSLISHLALTWVSASNSLKVYVFG